MKNTSFVLLLITLSLLAACGKGNKSGQSSGYRSPIELEDEVIADGSKESVLQQINKYRQAAGASNLRYDKALDNLAQGHANDLGDNRASLVAGDRQCSLRQNVTGENYACAELVIRGRIFSQDVLKELLQVPRNHTRLQNPSLNRVGIGSSMDRQGRAVWVLLMVGSR